jgi:TetR/AcrR family transcriptional repressor of nem operon
MSNEMSDRILDLALDYIMGRGYKAFSYKDISMEIGIKTSSIHYYFPTKGDLGKALAQRFFQSTTEALELIDKTTQDPKEKISKFVRIFYENLKSGDRACPLAMLTSDYENLPEEVKREVINLIQLQETWLAKVLESGIKKKAFKFSGKPNDKAKAIFSAIEGATIASRAFSDPDRILITEDLIISSVT